MVKGRFSGRFFLATVGVVLLAHLLVCETASGALIRLDLEKITRKSRHVVCGEVTALKSYWADIPKLGRVILTDVTIRVDQSWKGSPGKEIIVKVFGGEVGDEFQVCVESPRFSRGEKVLVFVRDWKFGGLWTTGWLQGKLRLVGTPTGTQVQGKPHLPIRGTRPLTTVRDAVRKLVLKFESSRAPGK